MALLALLAASMLLALGGSNAAAELTAGNLSGKAPCEQRPPTIVSITNTYKTSQYDGIQGKTSYGEDVTVFCTACNVENLNFRELQAERYNTTTIKVVLKKLDLGYHEYTCTDTSTGYNETLVVNVYPSLVVTGPNVRQTNNYPIVLYFVPRGENYDVSCSGGNVENLAIADITYEKLKTKAFNNTITATVHDDLEDKHYICHNGHNLVEHVNVIVDYYPEARDFQCLLYYPYKLECSWRSSSDGNTFRLFSEDKLLCTDMSRDTAGGCVAGWNEDLYAAHVNSYSMPNLPLELVLQTCNKVFCNNLTFPINMRSIFKVDPVYNLQLTNRSSQSSIIGWLHRNSRCYGSCDYKVKYRLGTQWRQVVDPKVLCGVYHGRDLCSVQLPVLCPDTHYEVRVYVRDLDTLDDDKFWSEPASVEFVTDKSNATLTDASCELRRQKLSSVAVLDEARQLISDLNINLNQRLAEIKALMETET